MINCFCWVVFGYDWWKGMLIHLICNLLLMGGKVRLLCVLFCSFFICRIVNNTDYLCIPVCVCVRLSVIMKDTINSLRHSTRSWIHPDTEFQTGPKRKCKIKDLKSKIENWKVETENLNFKSPTRLITWLNRNEKEN